MRRVVVIAMLLIAAMLGVAGMLAGAFAQDPGIASQEETIRRARQQLAEIERLSGENTKQTTSSERALAIARNKIGAERRIVQGLDRQAGDLSSKINADERQIKELENQLVRLKKEYAEAIYSAWKNHKLNTATAFLLAARDFNDATRRLSHLRRYNGVRVNKGAEIDSLGKELQAEVERLGASKDTLDGLKAQSQAALSTLTKSETSYQSTLKKLNANKKKLEADAKKERDKIAAAQREIDRIIAAQAAGRGEVDVVLSGKFEDNKGRLPWPAGGAGTVLAHFGANRMADGITRDEKGITIATQAGAQVKAVFEGKVTGVYNIGQFDKCVTVRSGSYIVLYGNLTDTRLKTGDQVAINQVVGRINSSASEERHVLLLQIWRETTPLNPEEWLRK